MRRLKSTSANSKGSMKTNNNNNNNNNINGIIYSYIIGSAILTARYSETSRIRPRPILIMAFCNTFA